MNKTIARALWAFTLAGFAGTACNSNDHKTAANHGVPLASSEVVEASEVVEVIASTNTPAPEAVGSGDSSGDSYSLDDSVGSVRAPAGGESAPSAEPPRLHSKPMPSKLAKDARTSGQFAMGAKGRAVNKNSLRRLASAPVAMRPMPQPIPDEVGHGTEDYRDYGKNPMVSAAEDRLSTFAVDVDTASYAIARKKLTSGMLPPESAVRVEEFVNYFKYDYEGPVASATNAPFAVHMDMAPSPFVKGRKILRVGVQAKKLSLRERKSANLVFLVDVSGSMQSADKLELAKRAMRVLVDNLKDGDTVSLVTYAGNTRVVLKPTGLEKKGEIISALEDLRAGGSTAMASGMELAYGLAAQTLGPDSLSRVIVLSDGDANIGKTSHDDILKTIAGKVKEGVTLSTIGFGMGNYKDTLMERLANEGNGNYFYIDGMNQARRVFQEQLGGTLEVVAKDVKIQVDFDPKVVSRYRLIGYENRNIADQDFRNDKVDAGEIGAGHTVTAMYEVELLREDAVPVTVRLRAKKPKGRKAAETVYAFSPSKRFASFDDAPEDFRFASAVMAAAEILRGSEHATSWSLDDVLSIAKAASGAHVSERAEFVALIERARSLKGKVARR